MFKRLELARLIFIHQKSSIEELNNAKMGFSQQKLCHNWNERSDPLQNILWDTKSIIQTKSIVRKQYNNLSEQNYRKITIISNII